MKLNVSALDFSQNSYASGRITLESGQSKKVSLIGDGTIDYAVWNELTSARPELADSFVPSVHDPRFHNGGRAGGGNEFGDGWVKGRDEDGFYSQLGESDGVHQRVYNDPARIKTFTPNFTHTVSANISFDEVDTTSVRESLEFEVPPGASFQKN